MGQIHQLILEHGIDEAKARTLDKLDRQCVETAFAVMSDEEQRVGMTHAGFAMTALPHKAVRDTIWIRQGAGVKLRIESGLGTDDQHVGLPYGSTARLILLYLQTEAVNTRSREVELGRSMNSWLSKMGIDDGGNNFRLVRQQSLRLSLCRLTFFSAAEKATYVMNGSFVRSAILPNHDSHQFNLWQEAVRLDEGFYQLDCPSDAFATAASRRGSAGGRARHRPVPQRGREWRRHRRKHRNRWLKARCVNWTIRFAIAKVGHSDRCGAVPVCARTTPQVSKGRKKMGSRNR